MVEIFGYRDKNSNFEGVVVWGSLQHQYSIGLMYSPANTRRWTNVVIMLGRRWRRRTNIIATSGRHLVFAGSIFWVREPPFYICRRCTERYFLTYFVVVCTEFFFSCSLRSTFLFMLPNTVPQWSYPSQIIFFSITLQAGYSLLENIPWKCDSWCSLKGVKRHQRLLLLGVMLPDCFHKRHHKYNWV